MNLSQKSNAETPSREERKEINSNFMNFDKPNIRYDLATVEKQEVSQRPLRFRVFALKRVN